MKSFFFFVMRYSPVLKCIYRYKLFAGNPTEKRRSAEKIVKTRTSLFIQPVYFFKIEIGMWQQKCLKMTGLYRYGRVSKIINIFLCNRLYQN